MQDLNFYIWTILSSTPIFLLGLMLILSSTPIFNLEAYALCPNGYHKNPSGDCKKVTNIEGLSSPDKPAITQQGNQTITSSSNFTNFTTGFLTYRSPFYGFKIDYPNGAEIRENPDSVVIGLPNLFHDTSFDMTTPRLRIEFNIEVKPGMTLDSLTRKLVSDTIHQEELAPQAPHIFSINKTKVHGSEDANLAVYDYKFGHDTYKEVQMVTIKNNLGYNIWFAVYPNQFDMYLPTVKKMIDSFELIGLT